MPFSAVRTTKHSKQKFLFKTLSRSRVGNTITESTDSLIFRIQLVWLTLLGRLTANAKFESTSQLKVVVIFRFYLTVERRRPSAPRRATQPDADVDEVARLRHVQSTAVASASIT